MSVLAEIALLLALACFAVPAWVYVGYPVLLLARRAAGERPVRRGAPPATVTVVVPAHDEERLIERKIRGIAAARGGDRAEIVLVSDGSTDRTVEIGRRLQAEMRRLLVLDLPRVGKARALDAAVEAGTGEVLVFTDANALWEAGSLAELVEPFADPEVGGVAGVQRYRQAGSAESAGEGEATYWQWDTWLKSLESAIHSCYGADGSLYAVRRELYVPLADPAQADDMAISMRVVTQGRRLVLAPRAVAWEDAPADPAKELQRKIRVTNHSLRSLFLLGPALWTSGWYSVVLVSHKLLRHLVPIFLVAGLMLTLAATPFVPEARWLLVPQALVYGLGLAGWALRRTRAGRLKPLLVPYYFCLANAAALAGSLKALRGHRITAWTHDRKGPA